MTQPAPLIVPAQRLAEGAGVTVHRTIGTAALRNLDPFLMLDHFGSDNPGDYIAGFPNHPHRGFVTLTYMLDGHMLHEDSMGNRGDLRSGELQWMKAARGVIHSEMPQQTDGLMRGFQLWINLPAAEKMSDPTWQNVTTDQIPQLEREGAGIKLIAGTLEGHSGPIDDPSTQLSYLDVTLAAQARWTLECADTRQGFIYAFEGTGQLQGNALPVHHLVTLVPGQATELVAGDQGLRFIQVSGTPLREPIVQYGPFVMNSDAEIRQALYDYQRGNLTQ